MASPFKVVQMFFHDFLDVQNRRAIQRKIKVLSVSVDLHNATLTFETFPEFRRSIGGKCTVNFLECKMDTSYTLYLSFNAYIIHISKL